MLAKVESNNNPEGSRYEIVDLEAKDDLYYRLAQYDFDGTRKFSPVILIEKENTTNEIRLSPNPAKEILNVKGLPQDVISIEVFDALGRKVHTKIEREELQKAIVYLNNITDGVYQLRIRTKSNSWVKKFVKEN